jgi:hypothetical protein
MFLNVLYLTKKNEKNLKTSFKQTRMALRYKIGRGSERKKIRTSKVFLEQSERQKSIKISERQKNQNRSVRQK